MVEEKEKAETDEESDISEDQHLETNSENTDNPDTQIEGEETAVETAEHEPDNTPKSIEIPEEFSNSEAMVIELSKFTGPLDLLLHLIKKHEMDIFDIPIAEITRQYLKYMEVLEALDLDHAGDFLVMASTLTHIKSKMLLPVDESVDEEDEEEGDPREELVRRLLEYQKYKNAAEKLNDMPRLGRDVFTPPADRTLAPKSDEVDVDDVSVFQLIEIFQELLDNAKQHSTHKVEMDAVKVEERITFVLAQLREFRRRTFRSLFVNVFSRPELVAMFLAILELTRLKTLRLYQTSDKGEIYLAIRDDAPTDKEIMDSLTFDQKDKSSTEMLASEQMSMDIVENQKN